MTAPRLHVIPATGCDKALVLRRGPTNQVASLLWDRQTDQVELGQWLNGRIYEHRSDLSPDGTQMIIFAGTGQRWWTAISRAPWLTATGFYPQDHTWHGGGAFTDDGRVFFNGRSAPTSLPDGLKPAAMDAFPHGTDGFHMGGLYAAMMRLRGWRHVSGERYETVLDKPVTDGFRLRLSFALHQRNRAIISNRYAVLGADGGVAEQPHWEWAEPWADGLQFAMRGAVWFMALGRGGPGKPRLIHDFTDMKFERREAPYAGVAR